MRAAIACLAALLAGCSTTIPVPETVKVPVPVSCIDAPIPKPRLVTDAELAAMDDYKATISLWIDRRDRQTYEGRLEAALAGCWLPGAGGV